MDAIAGIRVSIARTILTRRKAAGLTQQALADLAGVRQATIARLETGRQTVTQQTMAKIEKALEKSSGKAGVKPRSRKSA